MERDSQEPRTAPIPIGLKRLVIRARAIAVIFFGSAVVAAIILHGLLFSGAVGIMLFAIVMMIPFFLGLNPWMNAREMEKAANILFALTHKAEIVETKGLYHPRFVCRLRLSGGTLSDLTLRFQGGLAWETVAENATFELDVPWASPLDVVLNRRLSYSESPVMAAVLAKAQQALSPGEFIWTNARRTHIVSVITPQWGLWRKPDETAEQTAQRILERWRLMHEIRIQGTGIGRFEPHLVRRTIAGREIAPVGGFVSVAWCSACRRHSVWMNPARRPCPHCGSKMTTLLYSGSLEEKMQRIKSAGIPGSGSIS